MSVKEEDGSEGESKIKKGGRTPYDIQRSKLDKLMKDPSKPVFIPEMRKEKDPNKAPDFVYNVMGSSAGAGSGEFHIYRAIRRKETLRQEVLKDQSEKMSLNDAYHFKLAENERLAEERTAKKRAKRMKKKNNKKKAKGQKKTESSSSEDDEDEMNQDEGETDDKKKEETESERKKVD